MSRRQFQGVFWEIDPFFGISWDIAVQPTDRPRWNLGVRWIPTGAVLAHCRRGMKAKSRQD
jgi:hypothetical protein